MAITSAKVCDCYYVLPHRSTNYYRGDVYTLALNPAQSTITIYKSPDLGNTWVVYASLVPGFSVWESISGYIDSAGLYRLVCALSASSPGPWGYWEYDGASWSDPETWYSSVRSFGGMVPDLADEQPHINFGLMWGARYINRVGGAWGSVESPGPGAQGSGAGSSIALRPNGEPTMVCIENAITPYLYDRDDGVWTYALARDGYLSRHTTSNRMWFLATTGAVYYRDGSGTGAWTTDYTFTAGMFGSIGGASVYTLVASDIAVNSLGEVFAFFTGKSRYRTDTSVFVVKRSTSGVWGTPVLVFEGANYGDYTTGRFAAVQNAVSGWGLTWEKYKYATTSYERWWSSGDDFSVPPIYETPTTIWRTARIADPGRHPRNMGREVRSGINE